MLHYLKSGLFPYKTTQHWDCQPEILATKWLFLVLFSERVSASLRIHLNWLSNTCLTQFKWHVEKSERGAFKCRRWQHVRPRMYRLCGFLTAFSHHSSPPSLPTRMLVSSSHSLFCSLFFPLSLCLSLPLSFSSGCYISIMQPLPAREGERIRPTLPSVVACQPRLYILSKGSQRRQQTLSLHIWNGVDRIIINGKQGTHREPATS